MRTVRRKKRCPQCGRTKSTDLFNKNRAQADGLQTRCRMCENGIDERKCPEPGCNVILHGYQKRCDEHRTEHEAWKIAAAERGAAQRRMRSEKAAAEAARRAGRTCERCGADISHRGLIAKYCETCYVDVNRQRQHADYAVARKIVVRACDDCGADITERATEHPLAMRCEACQAKHRSRRKRPKPKVERLCAACGADIRGRAKSKTICTECEPKPPRWCIGCGQVDLRGQAGLRCEKCKVRWDAGASERVRQWQADNSEATMLIRARSRAKKRGLECTITIEDVKAAWPGDGCCPVYGMELVRNFGRRHASPESPSLDRIDNTKGYIPGNVWVISLMANGTKQDLSLEDLADGSATPEWQVFATAYLAQNPRPRRRVVANRQPKAPRPG